MSEPIENKDELGQFARQVAEGVARRIHSDCVSAVLVMRGKDVFVASTTAKPIVDKMIVELALSIIKPAQETQAEEETEVAQ
jgi:hypothetical protein